VEGTRLSICALNGGCRDLAPSEQPDVVEVTTASCTPAICDIGATYTDEMGFTLPVTVREEGDTILSIEARQSDGKQVADSFQLSALVATRLTAQCDGGSGCPVHAVFAPQSFPWRIGVEHVAADGQVTPLFVSQMTAQGSGVDTSAPTVNDFDDGLWRTDLTVEAPGLASVQVRTRSFG
jgi:hypothetical protein